MIGLALLGSFCYADEATEAPLDAEPCVLCASGVRPEIADFVLDQEDNITCSSFQESATSLGAIDCSFPL